MIKIRTLITCWLAVSGMAMAQLTVFSDPVGFVSVTVPAQSDAVLSVPLQRTEVFRGTIASISGNDVTLSSTPTLTPGVVYALLVSSGSKEGMIARITAQSGATVTVTLGAGDDFTGVATGASGAQAAIMPYWTPASMLPTTAPVGTQLLGFENAGSGVNLSSTKIYVHAGSGAWEDAVSGADASAAPLAFGTAFVLRNTSGSGLTVSFVGDVPGRRHRLNLATLAANTPQDIRVGYRSPIFETLDNVGLGGAADGDQILGFNNAATGFNKSATLLLIMDGGVWKDQVSGNPVGATFQFTPGFGYIYRKAATPSPSVSVWSDLPGYLPFQ